MSIFGAAVTQCHRLGDLNNRAYNLTTLEACGWKSSLIPSKGCEGRLCCRPLSVTCRWPFHPCVSFFFFLIYLAVPGVTWGMQELQLWHADLVLQPGIKSKTPALGTWSLNPWTTREVPFLCFFTSSSLCACLCAQIPLFLGAPVILDWGPL